MEPREACRSCPPNRDAGRGIPRLAVVLDTYAGQITLINTHTRHVFAPVTVGDFPVAVAISG